VNRSVILVFCAVLLITALMFTGKRSAHPPQNAASNGQAGAPAQSNGHEPTKGQVAPDFTLKSIPDGKDIQLSSLRGKAVLVNFWATWCEPCKIEMPWLVDLQKKYGSDGLQIVGVAMDDTSEKTIADFAKKMGVNYPVLKGTENVGDMYGGIEGLPTSYFLDRSGRLVASIKGLDSESKFEDNIKKSLAGGASQTASSAAPNSK